MKRVSVCAAANSASPSPVHLPSFAVKNVSVGAMIQVTAKTDYVNCRATSPRRLDVHGAFTVKLKITAEGGREVVCDATGGGLYTRNQPVSYSVPAASAEKTFTISEVLDLGSGKPPAEKPSPA